MGSRTVFLRTLSPMQPAHCSLLLRMLKRNSNENIVTKQGNKWLWQAIIADRKCPVDSTARHPKNPTCYHPAIGPRCHQHCEELAMNSRPWIYGSIMYL